MAEIKNKNWQRINFECSECGEVNWTEFDVNTYVLKAHHLVCDDCYIKTHPEDC